MPLFTRPICVILLIGAVFLFLLGMYVNTRVAAKLQPGKAQEQ